MPHAGWTEPIVHWRVKVFALLVFFVFMAASLIGLGWYPMPHCDEANHAAVSYSFFHHGRFTLDYLDDLGAYGKNFASQGRLYHTTKGLLLEVFGYTLFAGRLYSWLGGLLAALFVYLTGRRLYNEPAGLLGALVLAASGNAFYASHVGREETWVVASGMGILYYYLVIRDAPTRLRYTFLGLLTALTVGIHPNTVWYSLPVGVLALTGNVRTSKGRVYILFLALGSVMGAALVIAMQLLPDPAAALDNLRFEAAGNYLLTGGLWQRVLDQLAFMRGYYLTNLNGSAALATAYFALGVIYAVWRRTSSDRLLLAVWSISFLSFTLLLSHKSPFYGVTWEPLLAVLAGAALVRLPIDLPDWTRPLGVARLAVLLAAPLLLLGLAAQVWLTAKFSPRDFNRYLAEVSAQIPPHVHVMADPALWFAFQGRLAFTADTYLDYCRAGGMCSDLTAQEAARLVKALGIDYVVEDGAAGCAASTTPTSQAWADYLAEACTRVGTVQDRWFGADGQLAQGRETHIYDCTVP